MPLVRRITLAVLALSCGLAGGPAPALGAPDCPGGPVTANTLLSGQGTLESVITDASGRLFFTNGDSLLRLDARGSQPVTLAAVLEPGGLAFDGDGKLIVGFGNSVSNGVVGDETGPAGLLRVDPDSGAQEVYATGLAMANGLARAPDGSFYASNDFGSNIDRVRNGQTDRGWAKVESGNGLVVDSSGRYLYVAQTFRPAAIRRIDLQDPTRITDYVRATGTDISAGLDGMARDARDRLFVAANGSGEVWRIDQPPQICVLLRGLPGFPDGPSAVATGSGDGPFGAGNLYVVTFNGNLIELVGVAAVEPAPEPARGGTRRRKIRLTVRPHRTVVGRTTRFRFRASVRRDGRWRPVRGARIRFGAQRARTNRRGRARIVRTFSRPGRYLAGARRRALRGDRAAVRVDG